MWVLGNLTLVFFKSSWHSTGPKYIAICLPVSRMLILSVCATIAQITTTEPLTLPLNFWDHSCQHRSWLCVGPGD